MFQFLFIQIWLIQQWSNIGIFEKSRTVDSTSDLFIIAVIKGSRYSSTSFNRYIDNGSSSQDFEGDLYLQ